jgi:predicted nucleic acid-binding protein
MCHNVTHASENDRPRTPPQDQRHSERSYRRRNLHRGKARLTRSGNPPVVAKRVHDADAESGEVSAEASAGSYRQRQDFGRGQNLNLYFDSAYIAKCYLNEPDGQSVRALAREATGLNSSSLCIAEIACVFQRHVREGTLSAAEAIRLRTLFIEDIEKEVWNLVPLTNRLLHRVEFMTRKLPSSCYLRAGDAIHIVSAVEAELNEIWTNDRHLLAAAAYFGIAGRVV